MHSADSAMRSTEFSGTRQRIVVALNARSVSSGMISPLTTSTTSTHTAKAVATVWKTPPSCADPVIPQKEKMTRFWLNQKPICRLNPLFCVRPEFEPSFPPCPNRPWTVFLRDEVFARPGRMTTPVPPSCRSNNPRIY